MSDLDALKALGWSGGHAPRQVCEPPLELARVAAVDRDRLLLMDAGGLFRAGLSGSFRHQHVQGHEWPCVGDWVCVQHAPGDDLGVIHAVLDRRTSLCRKQAGPSVVPQMIAANVDVVVIVQSCHFDFNIHRLERYLVMVMEGGAEPLILLTKTDRVSPDTLAAQRARVREAGITAPILTLSNVTQEGVDELERQLQPGRTYCFVGSSGVGKSTLINHLIGNARQETGGVSGTGEGRHTTVRRELIRLRNGALVIDNPGMRELGLWGAGEGLEAGFSDIAALAPRCRYRDCSHTGEPGCAVQAAVDAGDLDPGHLEHFHKLRREAEFHERSRADQRDKERSFGRFLKKVKSDLKRHA